MAKFISITQKGNFKKTDGFFNRVISRHYLRKLNQFGEMGVKALSEATPKDSGVTSQSWSYEIVEEAGSIVIYWKNSNVNRGVNIALILQYGHGTKNGGYVEGIDYINPAIQPIFSNMAEVAWREICS